MQWIFEPGLFSNHTVRIALLVGLIAAIVSAIVGVFTVLRGQSFAGHALTDVATAGGSGAFLAGLAPIVGFVGGGVIGAGAMDAIGVQRVRGRDIATGVVLGAATGLSALFLYLSATSSASSGATQLILFGSIFTVAPSTLPEVAILSCVVLLSVALIARPLLLSSLNTELAAARGVHVRIIGLVFMVTLAVSVGLSAIVIGSILSTALLIGPPASALKVVNRFWLGAALAAVLGVGATWAGIVFAYDSYYWTPSHRALPVSFFVVAVVVLEFAFFSAVRRRRRGRTAEAIEDSSHHVETQWH